MPAADPAQGIAAGPPAFKHGLIPLDLQRRIGGKRLLAGDRWLGSANARRDIGAPIGDHQISDRRVLDVQPLAPVAAAAHTHGKSAEQRQGL